MLIQKPGQSRKELVLKFAAIKRWIISVKIKSRICGIQNSKFSDICLLVHLIEIPLKTIFPYRLRQCIFTVYGIANGNGIGFFQKPYGSRFGNSELAYDICGRNSPVRLYKSLDVKFFSYNFYAFLLINIMYIR